MYPEIQLSAHVKYIQILIYDNQYRRNQLPVTQY